MNGVLGWDIGGVNTKVARVAGARVLAAHAAPYELQRDPAALAPLLAHLARDLGAGAADPHGVTMTAELSQLFRTKREGVAFVLDAVAAAFPDACVRVWSVDARWRTPAQARREPLAVAAANWAATAHVVGRLCTDCLLVDVGSTTTDIIRREKSNGISSTLLYLSSDNSRCSSWCCRTARSRTFFRPV